MERLTSKLFTKACCDTWEFCGLDGVCGRDCWKPTPCKIPALVYRLAEIEDILGDQYDLDDLREKSKQVERLQKELDEVRYADKNLGQIESKLIAIRELIEKEGCNGWISVDDHLPPDEDSGLDFFCMTTAKASCDSLIALTFEHTFVRGKEVRRWKWGGRLCPWEVTHWMPRPIPPRK